MSVLALFLRGKSSGNKEHISAHRLINKNQGVAVGNAN